MINLHILILSKGKKVILLYKDKVLIFVHIPKTAGSSLTNTIYTQYNPTEVFSLDNPALNKVSQINKNTKCLLGHNRFGQHKELGPCIYITMLRDPIERVISHYYYLKYILNYEHIGKYSLGEFAQLDLFSNMQTQFITGGKPDLEQAINNLKTFAFFGITEMYNESLFLMKKTFGWENIHYSKVNVNPKKPRRETILKDTIEQIEKANQLDLKLYQWAKENFKNQLKNFSYKDGE
jgi:hypothetical protein